MQILLPRTTATENWTQFTHTATIRSGCPATWTAYPSKALNATWTPSSTRPSWMVDLWILISTPRLQLTGFLRGWRPPRTTGCRARDDVRWDWWLLWREPNLTTKMFSACLIDEHSAFSYAGFYSQRRPQFDWKLESEKKMETSSFCQCDVTHLKQQSHVCQCTVWRTQTPKNILDLPKSWNKK